MNAEEALQLLDELNASGAPFDKIDDGLLSSDIDVMSSEEEERLDDDIAGLLGDQEESESDEENDNGYGASDSDSYPTAGGHRLECPSTKAPVPWTSGRRPAPCSPPAPAWSQ